MKKLFLIGLGFALAVVVFGVAGFAYAQTQEPPDTQTTDGPDFPYGRAGRSRGARGGMMDQGGDFVPGGMMGFNLNEGDTGPLHDYLWPAIAEAFGLSDEQIAAFEIVRETMQGIRTDFSQEEFHAAMQQAMTTAIENALADGAITEEQAEDWLERVDQMQGLPRIPFGGSRGRSGNFREGFSAGVNFGRQMMLNHEYLEAAMADELGLTVEEFQAMREEDGFNLRDYAEEQGLSDEELAALHAAILTNAVDVALEEGAITQEQADRILERLENFEGRGVWFGRP